MNKKKFTIISVVFLIVLMTISTLLITMRDEMTNENPIKGINPERSQVILVGTGPKMDNQLSKKIEQIQKEKEQIQKKQREISSNNNNENKGKTWQDTAPGNNANDGGEGKKPGDEGESVNSKSPVITTSLKDGEKVGGTYKGFTVSAVDYKGNKISRQFFQVYINGNRIYSSGSNDYIANYSFDLEKGDNTISISVTDSEGNQITKRVVINGDTNKPQPTKGYATLSINCKNLGLGYVIPPTEIQLYEKEKIAHVVTRFLTSKGISYDSTGNAGYGFYLERIYYPNITNGWKISSGLMSDLEARGSSSMGYDKDSLGEKDFFEHSGWMYSVNGEEPDTGSASVIAMDGDEIELWFTTHYGMDRSGRIE